MIISYFLLMAFLYFHLYRDDLILFIQLDIDFSSCLLPNVCFCCLCLWNHQTSSLRDSVLGIVWIIMLLFCRHIYGSSERYTLMHNPPRNPELFRSFLSQTLPNLISLPMAPQVVLVIGNLLTNVDWSDLGYTHENKY